MVKNSLIGLLVAATSAISPIAAHEWPTRPVTMVVPFAAGGPGDVFARIIAPSISEHLGQPVIIENAGTGGGLAGSLRVAKAPPDGYRFVYGNIGTHAQSQSLYKHPLYNAATDFAPVALVTETPTILATRNDLPVVNLSEFAVYTRANQAKLQFASGGAASPAHLACLLLNATIGVTVTHIPYRSGGQAMQEMIAGRVDYQCSGSAAVIPSIEAKQVKAIAILSRDRSAALPTLPSAHEQGLTNFDAGSWTALFLPKATPAEIVRKLNAAAISAMESPLVQRRLLELGATVVTAERRTPEYLQEFVEREIARWAAAIKDAGVVLE